MFVAFLIMLREGIEASLIVGIVATYLRQTGRSYWMPAVWIGIFLAVAISLFVGAGLQLASAQFPQKAQEFFEGMVGIIAAGILTSMVLWMRKASRSIKSELHHSIDAALTGTDRQGIAMIGLVFFAVAREGLESVFFLLAVFQQGSASQAGVGALLGIVVSALLGYALYRGGLKLNMRKFFRWTGVFVLLVAAGLLASSLWHLHEAGIWNLLQQVVFDLSGSLPVTGPVGALLSGVFGYRDAPTLGEVLIYLAFLAISLPLFLAPHRPPQSATPTPNLTR